MPKYTINLQSAANVINSADKSKLAGLYEAAKDQAAKIGLDISKYSPLTGVGGSDQFNGRSIINWLQSIDRSSSKEEIKQFGQLAATLAARCA